MKLDRTTYELFIIDYLEGNLNPVQVSELLLFLEQNPDLKQEFEGVENVYLVHDEFEQSFEKSTLKKEETLPLTPHLEELLIANLEGDLTSPQMKELSALRNVFPSIEKEIHAFSQTKLSADTTLVFQHKRSLKKWTITPWIYRATAVAAILLAGAFVVNVITSTQQTQPKQVLSFGAPLVKKPNQPKPKKQFAAQPVNTSLVNTKTSTPNLMGNKPALISGNVKSTIITCELVANISRSNPVISKPQFEPVLYTNNVTTVTLTANTEFVTAKDWVKQKVNETTNENTLVNNINKTTGAGISVERDSESGKVRSFEISSLGLAFSK